jgi:hypothetical protein
MADYGAVGGLEPLGDRYGPVPQQPERHLPHRDDGQKPLSGDDSADLSAATEVVYPLLRQRVLDDTKRRMPAGAPLTPGAFWRAGAPSGPVAAVAWIQSEQRWLWGVGTHEDAAELRAAFDAGLAETAEILREVTHGDVAVEQWLAGVRAHLRAPD